MAKPTIGDSVAFTGPPIELAKDNKQLYDFLLMVFDHIYGLGGNAGSLNADNVSSIPHAAAINVTAYQHHGAGQHANLDRSSALADLGGVIAASTVAFVTPDAGLAYTANEQTLINEAKVNIVVLTATLNALITQVNAITAHIDTLKANLRTSGLLTT